MKFLSILFIALLPVISYSNAHASRPSECPLVQMIKMEGVSSANRAEGEQGYIAYHKSTYQSQYKWRLSFGYFYADNPSDVLAQANKAIKKIYGAPIPVKHSEDGFKFWVCEYQSPNDLRILAFIPTGK